MRRRPKRGAISGLVPEASSSQIEADHAATAAYSVALPPPPMSSIQQAAGCTWVRAALAFPDAVVAKDKTRGRDVIQDNVSDCSIVTALMVAAEHHARFRSHVRVVNSLDHSRPY